MHFAAIMHVAAPTGGPACTRCLAMHALSGFPARADADNGCNAAQREHAGGAASGSWTFRLAQRAVTYAGGS
jgi:hypothetical protein